MPTSAQSSKPAAPPTPPGVDPRRGRLLFGGLALTILLASLDQTIMSSALPTIVGELDGVEHVSWVITAYILAATIVMPVYGRLGDLVGRKHIFLAAIAIFLAGSVVAGAADSMGWLIAGRFVQGLGGGGVVVTAQAIVADVIPALVRELPDALRTPVVTAYADALAPVFGYLAPLFLVGALLVVFIPPLPLRTELDGVITSPAASAVPAPDPTSATPPPATPPPGESRP